MTEPEAKIEMAQRYVREGEAHVVKQREVVAELRAQGNPAQEAERLLALLEGFLDEHRQHLARLTAKDV